MNRKLYKHKDNAEGLLNAGISASTLTIPLQSGQGALLPSTLTGSATSGGTTTALNSTGIQAALSGASLGVGDIIENVTDGSYAIIKSISTNAIVTTRLKGGSDNTWQNSDVWAINRFVITLVKYDTDGETVLRREKVLIQSRSGDNLTVNTTGRGFDGSTAASFDTGDHVYLFMTSAAIDGIQQALAQAYLDIEELKTAEMVYFGVDSGSNDDYSVTISNFPSAYAAGQKVVFKANTANSGASTLNVNGLGSRTIKKEGSLDLADNNINSGEIVEVVYDGAYFQLTNYRASSSPPGMVIPYAGITAPSGWLLCDGSAVSRTTYANLFSVMAPTIGTFTITIASPGVVTLASHGLATGDSVYLTTTGALPTGLSANTRYWVTKIDANTFKLATSLSNALSSTNINTSGSQSGTHTLRLCPYGIGDGSTTFNVPNMQGVVPVGKNQSDTEFAGLGQTGGEKTHALTTGELATHSHTMGTARSGGGGGTASDYPWTASNGGVTQALSGVTGDQGSGTAHNNVQPYVTLNYIVKT